MSIQLQNVNKIYSKQFALDQINLDIQQGELFVLLGASGSGKSTILRAIAGLLPIDSGQIILNNRDVTRLSPQKRDVGFVFQNYSLFGHMTVEKNIAFGLEIRNVPKRARAQRVAELLELVGLSGYEGRLPYQLSGGQQQRIALARALAPNPEVLLLDEPFGALDVKIRGQLRQNLHKLQKQLNITTILVTHDQEEAFELADRIAVIENGRILEINTPDNLYRRPQTHYTATFVGQANLLTATRNSSRVVLDDVVSLPVPPDTEHLHNQPVDILCRPEEIVIVPEDQPMAGYLIGLGLVQDIVFTGHYLKVSLTLQTGASAGQTLQAIVSPAYLRETGILPSQQVQVGVKDYHLLATKQTE